MIRRENWEIVTNQKQIEWSKVSKLIGFFFYLLKLFFSYLSSGGSVVKWNDNFSSTRNDFCKTKHQTNDQHKP